MPHMVKGARRGEDAAEPGKPGVRAPDIFKGLRAQKFEIQMISHAEAILCHDMGSAASEIEEVLGKVRIPVEELVRGGGGEAQATQRLRKALVDTGWHGHNFEIRRIVDGVKIPRLLALIGVPANA